MMLEVAKVNKRLIICEADTNKLIYAMPNFLVPIRDRSVLQELADRLSAGDGITAIIEFETAHNPRVRKGIR